MTQELATKAAIRVEQISNREEWGGQAALVLICASCGQTNPAEARFCFACGVGLEVVPGGRDFRKTVTVLFSDVTGSTAIGELLDAEQQSDYLSVDNAKAWILPSS